jgi:N-formylglutamate amidohydrolase
MWKISYSTDLLVSRYRGTLPVLLTCPHGGGESVPAVPPRTGQGIPENCDFSDDADLNTRPIAQGVAQRLLELCGEAPYVVIADFHRKFIDANRRRECAYEADEAARYYDQYHNTVRNFADEIRAENGGLGLIFDIHGTAGIANDTAQVFLGTDDGKTPARLLRADALAPWRRRSLRGFLEAAGYIVSPRQKGVPETPALSGGYTVRTYGSSNADGLDAMQLEIVPALRKDEDERAKLIEVLAFAIANLVARYADTHVLTAVQSSNLLDANAIETVVGQLQRRSATNDARLQLGGKPANRGRVEIRHDAATPRRAGVLVLYDEDGRDHYLWVDNRGNLRIAPADPGANGQTGTIVGTQA